MLYAIKEYAVENKREVQLYERFEVFFKNKLKVNPLNPIFRIIIMVTAIGRDSLEKNRHIRLNGLKR